MKLSKQFLMMAPMLFILIATGCSKNLFSPDNGGTILTGEEESVGPWDPKTQNGGDASSGLYEKPGARQNFAGGDSALPGDDTTSALSAEPSVEKNGAGVPSGQSSSQNGDTSSGPGDASSGLEDTSSGLGDASSGLYEKPGPGPDFGSAPRGMPGDGATGSYSAESLEGDRETTPEPDADFFREENVGELETASRGYEKPGPGPDFGSASQGMPGDGSTGSYSAEPYAGGGGQEGGGRGQTPESAEPFLPEAGENMAVALPRDEESRRKLPYLATDDLEDIHFAFDKFDLDNKSKAILQKNIVYLQSHPNVRIEIQGHCDERGSNNYNITLGERRARSTKAFLISNGIDEHRIHAISYGEERPFCFENNEKCWYQNRRGHFLVAE